MLWGISEMKSGRAFKPCAIVFSTPENLLVESYLTSRNESKPLSKLKHVFWENAVGYLRNGEC